MIAGLLSLEVFIFGTTSVVEQHLLYDIALNMNNEDVEQHLPHDIALKMNNFGDRLLRSSLMKTCDVEQHL